MRERPLLMSGPLVRAVLDGRKTQTRRPIKQQPIEHRPGSWSWPGAFDLEGKNWTHAWHEPHRQGWVEHMLSRCPFGQVGDRLWVRETWQAWVQTSAIYDEWMICEGPPSTIPERYGPPHIDYQADFLRRYGAWERDDRPGHTIRVDHWRPSIHMPRWASRLTLRITDVRVERLQAISEEDARAEGVETLFSALSSSREKFQAVWDDLETLYGPTSWDANPWVWAISFEREVAS